MRGFLRSLIVGFILVSGVATVFAQIPDEFTNLKLLPKDISKGELIGTMRDWAVGLGVRCSHCHVGPDNLQGMDFASDEKKSKQTARRMLKMSRAINGDLLKDLPIAEDDGHTQVVDPGGKALPGDRCYFFLLKIATMAPTTTLVMKVPINAGRL